MSAPSHPPLLLLACGGAALLLTLVLAARCTPRAWWRRPNARALAVLVLGTGLIGGALWAWLAPRAPVSVSAPAPVQAALAVPAAGHSYRVADALNLRAARGTGARRVLVLAAGSTVQATGQRDGDWWQVTANADGQRYEGWASSLWLRRADERRPSGE
ncbi:SH3 domain-containing protein [Massilia litorea]|uniref:SH3 domain-containing protein n=1 Tax=Massilia litorea TaxID=2769491 RepID=A0A7L9U4U1_9BURK|nr:SH3 domain-containing protein [Massilia litorea]QOL49155.1 SH3 domain-containing protein [Massilia litorea]